MTGNLPTTWAGATFSSDSPWPRRWCWRHRVASHQVRRDGKNGGVADELADDELADDLVIIGGGLGGCAAALAASRRGLRVIMTEETDWIGRQLSQQAVPPDENAWIETIGGTRSYLALRAGMRDYYCTQTPLTARANANPRVNPGNCWVSRIGCEPRVHTP